MTKISHEREINGAKKFWEALGFTTEKFSFRPDYLVTDLFAHPRIEELFDCKYIWIELVGTSPLKPEKRYWLPKILSKEWLIVVQRYGPEWEPIRPETYDGKKSYEETKKAFQILWRMRYNLSPLE